MKMFVKIKKIKNVKLIKVFVHNVIVKYVKFIKMFVHNVKYIENMLNFKKSVSQCYC